MNRFKRSRLTLTIVAAALLQAGSGVVLAEGGGHDASRQHDQMEQHQQGHDKKQHGNKAASEKEHRNEQSQSRTAPQRFDSSRRNEDERHRAPGNSGNAHAYTFEQQDRARLKQHYQRVLGHVDHKHRPHFEPGYIIPNVYRVYITPVPLSLRRHLPPPPAGYLMGYYQGYTVVYDPTTFAIITLVDLLLLQ